MRLALPIGAVTVAIVGLLATVFAEDAETKGEKLQLKLNLAPGDSRTLSLNIETDIHSGPSNQPLTYPHATGRLDTKIGVRSIDDAGNCIVQMTPKRIAFGVKGLQLDLAFDSDIPAEQTKLETPYARALINLPFGLKLDSAGQPLEVLEVDQLIEQLKAKQIPIARAWTKQESTTVMDAMKLIMAPLPNKPVGIGDKWKMQCKTELLQLDATYKLYDFRDGVAFVDLIGTIKIDFFDIKGSTHGQIQIDQRSGWLIKEVIDLNLSNADSTLTIDGTLTVTGK